MVKPSSSTSRWHSSGSTRSMGPCGKVGVRRRRSAARRQRSGGAADDQPRWYDYFPATGRGTVQPVDGTSDGQTGHPTGILRDGGEVDVGQPGQPAVVEADDADVLRHRKSRVAEDVQQAGGAPVVEHGDGGRTGNGGKQLACLLYTSDAADEEDSV